ncbi:hypothetical protein CRUP_013034 [Coryphaenoides rupestris]|nr:hypothetical protein CRUP_013034 [Coryphaenoides rupestris]
MPRDLSHTPIQGASSSQTHMLGWGAVPAVPVNVSVTQLRAHSAMVTWSVPLGDTVIGYAISQQYDIIKDNDSNSGRDKTKRPSVRAPSVSYYHPSASSSPVYHNGSVHASKQVHLARPPDATCAHRPDDDDDDDDDDG